MTELIHLDDSKANVGHELLISTLSSENPVYRKLVPIFVNRVAEHVRTLQELLYKRDWLAIRNLAHQLKGAGGGYGLQVVTNLGAELEHSAEEEVPDLEQVTRLIHQLEAVSEQMKVDLPHWL